MFHYPPTLSIFKQTGLSLLLLCLVHLSGCMQPHTSLPVPETTTTENTTAQTPTADASQSQTQNQQAQQTQQTNNEQATQPSASTNETAPTQTTPANTANTATETPATSPGLVVQTPKFVAETTQFSWQFEGDLSTWQATDSNASVVLSNNGYLSTQALSISGRVAQYVGPAINLTNQLKANQTYLIRLFVSKSFSTQDDFKLNLQIGADNANPIYRELNRISVSQSDTWHLMRAFVRLTTAEASQALRVYVNTQTALGNFAIDAVSITTATPLPTTSALPPLTLSAGLLKQANQPFNLKSINLIAYQDYNQANNDAFSLSDYLRNTYHAFDLMDFYKLKALGFNSLRLALDARWFEDSLTGNTIDLGYEWLDFVLAWAEETGLYVTIDMHAPIGGGNQGPTGVRAFWQDAQYPPRLTNWWKTLAQRYQGRSVIAAFDLLNEPNPNQQADYINWLNSVIPAITQLDSARLLIVENTFAQDATWVVRPETNVIHDVHIYDPWQTFTNHATSVWGQGTLTDSGLQQRVNEIATAYANKAVHIGEYGQISATFDSKNAVAWLTTLRTEMETKNWHHAYFCFKGNEFGLYGSENRFAMNSSLNSSLESWFKAKP